MAEFKKTSLLSLPRVQAKVTADALYWKNLTFPVIVKEVGQIDFVDFSSSESSYFAATCSSRIQLYNTLSAEVVRTFSRFRYAAFGGKFRADGKLLVSGSDEGAVRLFDVKSKSVLRSFNGHNASTHRCDFSKDGTRIVSFSDDKSAIVWDIPSEKEVISFKDCHGDYIRAGLACQASQDTFLSGSYDHTVKLLDSRTGKPGLSVNHGSPVESVIMFPSGTIFISAGGNMVKVWSAVGGKLFAQMIQHHKTVTCLCFAKDHKRLMSGSLDRHVKIYDTNTYKVVHTLDYPSAVLSVAVSQGDKAVVAGMADGLLSIRRYEPPKENQKSEPKKRIFYRYQVHGSEFKPSLNDLVVSEELKEKIPKYDHYLRTFQSTKVLDVVMSGFYVNRKPFWTVSVMQELIRRGLLKPALAGRDEASLAPILKFVIKHLPDPHYIRILMDVADSLVSIYSPVSNMSPNIQQLFKTLHNTVSKELAQMEEMFEIQGVLETVLANANGQSIAPKSLLLSGNTRLENGIQ